MIFLMKNNLALNELPLNIPLTSLLSLLRSICKGLYSAPFLQPLFIFLNILTFCSVVSSVLCEAFSLTKGFHDNDLLCLNIAD